MAATTTNGKVDLKSAQAEAMEIYRAMAMPDRAQHLWRYTDPAEFELKGEVTKDAAGEVEIEAPGGVIVRPLREVADREIAEGRLGGLVPPGFGKPEALNAAAWSAGFFIRVPKGSHLDSPIRILTTLGESADLRATRHLVVVEEGASATIVEESRGPANGARRSLNEVTELYAAARSQVRWVPLQHLGRGAVSHRTFRASLAREAKITTVIASFGAGLYKADIGVNILEAGAESRMIGVTFSDGRQRADHHTVHDHQGRRTYSDIDFRTVLNGRARSAYTGLIRIAKEADYTEAFQENRNLLLSEQARAESIPELEILTDEVRCKHGATVGPVDPEQLFYLGTRGLSRAEATRMVVSGFLEATLSNIPESLAASIRDDLDRRLAEVAQG